MDHYFILTLQQVEISHQQQITFSAERITVTKHSDLPSAVIHLPVTPLVSSISE